MPHRPQIDCGKNGRRGDTAFSNQKKALETSLVSTSVYLNVISCPNAVLCCAVCVCARVCISFQPFFLHCKQCYNAFSVLVVYLFLQTSPLPAKYLQDRLDYRLI